MIKFYLFSLCLLVAGCGGSSDSSQSTAPPPTEVSESIIIGQPLTLDWRQSKSNGGTVFSTAIYEEALYASLDNSIWRYQQDVWEKVSELKVGQSHLLTLGDLLLTDGGSIFDGTTVISNDLTYGLLAVNQQQQTIFAGKTYDESLYFSDDLGETFELLPPSMAGFAT